MFIKLHTEAGYRREVKCGVSGSAEGLRVLLLFTTSSYLLFLYTKMPRSLNNFRADSHGSCLTLSLTPLLLSPIRPPPPQSCFMPNLHVFWFCYCTVERYWRKSKRQWNFLQYQLILAFKPLQNSSLEFFLDLVFYLSPIPLFLHLTLCSTNSLNASFITMGVDYGDRRGIASPNCNPLEGTEFAPFCMAWLELPTPQI